MEQIHPFLALILAFPQPWVAAVAAVPALETQAAQAVAALSPTMPADRPLQDKAMQVPRVRALDPVVMAVVVVVLAEQVQLEPTPTLVE